MKIVRFLVFLLSLHSGLVNANDGGCFTLIDSVCGSILAAAAGDALGRVTEFLSMEQIYAKYPHGVRSFSDFKNADFIFDEKGKMIAPYTDDTRMALLVAQMLADASKHILTCDQAMNNLAELFISDMYDEHGWAWLLRAPGISCLKGVCELERRSKNKISYSSCLYKPWTWRNKKPWWDVGGNAGGCGSVMRAYPCGLRFADCPEYAERWAVAQSKLTHNAPSAHAACAAIAVGVAYAVQKKEPQEIVNKMIESARKYDEVTAKMIEKAIAYANDTTMPSEKVFNEFKGWSGHEAVAAAVYCFMKFPDDAQKAVVFGVNTPGDSDSIASLAGALVGARTGFNSLPKEWFEKIEDAVSLTAIGEQLACQALNTKVDWGFK